jgi:hypothetical protein
MKKYRVSVFVLFIISLSVNTSFAQEENSFGAFMASLSVSLKLLI